VSRQVSWLAGQRLRQAFPGSRPVALLDVGSPLTVAGAAPALGPIARSVPHRLPSWLREELNSPENLDVQDYGRQPTIRQVKYKDIFMSLYF